MQDLGGLQDDHAEKDHAEKEKLKLQFVMRQLEVATAGAASAHSSCRAVK